MDIDRAYEIAQYVDTVLYVGFALNVSTLLLGIVSKAIAPDKMSTVSFNDRLKLSYTTIPNEEAIFGTEYKRLKLFRIVSRATWLSLILRLVVALVLYILGEILGGVK